MAGIGFHFQRAARRAEAEEKPATSRVRNVFNEAAEKSTMKNQALNENLLSAVESGNTLQVLSLLASKADPDARTAEETPALVLAARKSADEKDNEKIVAALLEAGADPDLKDKLGMTALMVAAAGGNIAVAKALVKNFADTEATCDTTGEMAVDMARANGNTALAAMLEQKRQMRIFNRVVKLRKKAQEKKHEMEKNGSPVLDGLFSAFIGSVVLGGIAQFASRFHTVDEPSAADGAAAMTKLAEAKKAPAALAPSPKAFADFVSPE